jgi:hypothetical protein
MPGDSGLEFRFVLVDEDDAGQGQPVGPPATPAAPAAPAAVIAPAGITGNGGTCNGTDSAPQLLDALASLLRRTGGVKGLRRLLDAVEAAGCGG